MSHAQTRVSFSKMNRRLFETSTSFLTLSLFCVSVPFSASDSISGRVLGETAVPSRKTLQSKLRTPTHYEDWKTHHSTRCFSPYHSFVQPPPPHPQMMICQLCWRRETDQTLRYVKCSCCHISREHSFSSENQKKCVLLSEGRNGRSECLAADRQPGVKHLVKFEGKLR